MANDNENLNVEAPKAKASTAKKTASKTTTAKTTASKTTTAKTTATKSTGTASKTATATKSTGTASKTATATKSSASKTSASADTKKATSPKTTPKTSASEEGVTPASAPKVASKATPKSAPKAAAPKVAPKKVAPVVPQKTNAQSNLTVEDAKEAELQKVTEEAKSSAPQKKKTIKKLVYLLVIIALIAGIAVAAVLVLPNLLSSEDKPIEIDLANPDLTTTETLNFEEPVDNYVWGTPLDRGIAVKNTGESPVLVSFKLEIFDDENCLIASPINATPIFENESLWTIGDAGSDGIIYYYYNDVVRAEEVRVLFRQYFVTAEAAIANQYHEQTVHSRITVFYTNATEENVGKLGEHVDTCWNEATSAWKHMIVGKINQL